MAREIHRMYLNRTENVRDSSHSAAYFTARGVRLRHSRYLPAELSSYGDQRKDAGWSVDGEMMLLVQSNTEARRCTIHLPPSGLQVLSIL